MKNSDLKLENVGGIEFIKVNGKEDVFNNIKSFGLKHYAELIFYFGYFLKIIKKIPWEEVDKFIDENFVSSEERKTMKRILGKQWKEWKTWKL